jgi:hypothetical protein
MQPLSMLEACLAGVVIGALGTFVGAWAAG